MNKHSKCIACESSDIFPYKNIKNKMLVSCHKCGVVFDQRIPTIQELEKHYSTYSYNQRKPVSAATKISFNKLLNYFEKFRDTNRILDVGCGQGDFLIAAQKRGWEVYGSEYSPAAVKLCKQENIEMYQGEFYGSAFGDIRFDVVTSFEVIEHTNNPRKLLSESLKPLRQNGLFYLTTPNFNSILRYLEKSNFQILGYPEHIAFYTPRSIQKFLAVYPLVKKKILTTGVDLARLKNLYIKKQDKKTNRCEAVLDNNNIRNKIEKGRLVYIKNIINSFLSFSGKGDTLKIFYIKSSSNK